MTIYISTDLNQTNSHTVNNLTKKVDLFTEKSEEFTKLILEYLGAIILETCPDVGEDIK